ncbi:MAG: glycosyltransferase family 39 protein [Chloroflexi bacterium]|nr:glycosyltransferase family 39 protein [Chloroflexota bacterium]
MGTWLPLTAILLLGIILRVLVMAVIGSARVPWELEFEEIADNLVSHGQYYYSFYHLGSPRPTSFIPPLYPFLLAFGRYLWQANGDWVVKSLQVVLSCSVIFSLYGLAREIGGSARQGHLVALLWAVYPPAASYVADLSTVTLESFFIVPAIWLVVRAGMRQSYSSALAAGALISLAALTRSTWLVLLPLSLAWLAWYHRHARAVMAKTVIGLGLAGLVVLSPWITYNFRTHGTLLLTSTNGGINFWIGNNPKATGEYVFPTEMDQALVTSVANWPEVPRDQFFYAKGIEFIRNSPGEFLNLAAHKLIYFFLFRPNIGSNYRAAQISLLDVASVLFVVSWFFLLPFALIGLAHVGGHWQEHMLFVLIFLSNAGVSMLYFSGTRFRTPIDGLAMIWAVMGFTTLSEKMGWRKVDAVVA